MLRKRRGMTLIEVIVAMAIFAIIVASLLPAFIFVARINVVSKDGVDITAIAQVEAEKFYNYSRTKTYFETLVISEVKTADDAIADGAFNAKILLRNQSGVTITTTLWNEDWDEDGDGDLEGHSGMTKIRVVVSLINNPQNSLPEQIDSILLFKKS